MRNPKLRMFVLVAFCFRLLSAAGSPTEAAPAGAARQSGEAGQFISLSDIHFNPFYDPKLVASLVQSEYTTWQRIFSRSQVSGYGTHSADSNYRLLNSALDNMYLRAPHPDFIIISGDFLAHDFQDTYAKLAGSSDPKAIRSFIDKTIAFVTLMIMHRFPNTAVYPALGNNDSDCGDYNLEPAGQFLRTTARAWKGLLKSASNTNAFLRTFPAMGSYTVIAPRNRNHRLIVLNTTFVSTNYQNKCGDPSAQPGNEELKWLEAELRKAAAAKQKVWLLYHIPAAIDVYASVNSGQPGQAVSMWQPEYNQQFLDLVSRNSNVIVASFAGHIHMDSFHLVQSRGQAPVSFVHITPAISPLFGNNPAFDVFTYNRGSTALKDYTAYYFDLSSPAAQINEPVKWSREYSFAQSFAQPDVSTVTLGGVYGQMRSNQNNARTKYETYFNVSNTASPGITADNWRAYWCGIGNLTVATYSNCISNATSRRVAVLGE